MKCIVDGKKTKNKIWVGGVSENGDQVESPICSEECFKKACDLFLYGPGGYMETNYGPNWRTRRPKLEN